MTPDEIPDLIKKISYADARIMPSDPKEIMGMAALWAVVLADVPAAFAHQAVGEHYARSPFTIKPSDIAIRWRDQIRRRMQAHIDPVPDADPDDELAYRRALQGHRDAVASGDLPPARLALQGAPVDQEDVAAMRKEGGVAEWIMIQWRAGLEQARERRALILRHPDLAAQLAQLPLGPATPEQWTGAVPPELFNGVRNDSPRRPAILALLAEAERREAAA